MNMHCQLVTPSDYAELWSFLHDADEDDERIRILMTDGQHTSYAWWKEGKMVGSEMHKKDRQSVSSNCRPLR